MAIFLRESDVEKLATIDMAIEAVEEAFRLQGEEKADIAPRRRCRLADKGLLHVMSASLPTLGWAALKSYTTVSGASTFMVSLYKGGQLAACIQADKLGQLRTGAASAVATRHMARPDSSKLGIFGTGWQARAQIQAICAVRPIKSVIAYSRDRQKCEQFCREMGELLKVDIAPATTPEQAAAGMDIVVTATTSGTPVFNGEWISKGTHINAVGGNFINRQEIDVETVGKCACVVVDSREQARLESGDLARAAEAEVFFWEDARELGLVVVGEYPGREDDAEITLFESQGIALEDVALAAKIYEKASQAGIGESLPF